MRHLPPSLGTLLASPRVYKVGVGVAEDASKLLEDYGLSCSPTLEIGDTAVRLQKGSGGDRGASGSTAGGGAAPLTFPALPAGEVVRPGLRNLALACGYELAKPKKVTRSNWENKRLTPQQQKYAALDAYAGVWIARCIHALHAPLCGTPDFMRWLSQMAEASKAGQLEARSPASNKRRKKSAS